MKYILTLTTSILLLSSSLFGQTWNAGTDFGVLVADSDATYSPGFTLTDNPTSISAVGTDGPGNAISLWFNTAVDMSLLSSNGAVLTFTTNAGHVATTSFSLSLLNSSFDLLDDLSGLSFGDSSLVSSTSAASGLSDVKNILVNTGGIGDAVNVNIQSISIVPEPSTYALIAGFAAFLFVAIRRRK
jgi:hypothetical protein